VADGCLLDKQNRVLEFIIKFFLWRHAVRRPRAVYLHASVHTCTCTVITDVLQAVLQASLSHSDVVALNLGCLHPVARVISYDMGFNPSTQR
jgi:hypothetical protein